MREVINNALGFSTGTTLTGAATGQVVIGVIGLVLMFVFGLIGVYFKYKDSKAIQKNSDAIMEAIKSGDIQRAIEIGNKR